MSDDDFYLAWDGITYEGQPPNGWYRANDMACEVVGVVHTASF